MAKGVIVVEGPSFGRTDGGWTPSVPALTPVAGAPLLVHAHEAVRRAGAEHVLVVGDGAALAEVAPVLDGELAAADRLELERPGSAGDALLAAAGWLEGDGAIVHEADGLLLNGPDALRQALAATGDADATVFFASGEPVPGAPDAERVTGVHVFSNAIVAALEATRPGPGGRSMLGAIDRLAAAGGRVQAGVLGSWWTWDGTADGLLEANRAALDRLDPGVGRPPLEDCRVEGRVRVHPTAVVRRTVLRGPVVVGAGARVTDAYLGPYTTIGDGATIDDAEIESSVVLAAARIRNVGVRLEASVVGAGASVGRDFALPKALRLRIGRDASITLG